MNNINEGQTQVYANGMVTPQYGVNTNAPYLNTPPQQLMDITNEFFKSGKSPSQVLAILVGMGTPQQLAKTAIETYAIGAMQENQQKNHNKMFTLTELYERVNKTATELKTVAEDTSRVSYSAKNAMNVLESALKEFPAMFKVNSTINEELEAQTHPVLKFRIAKNLHRSLSTFDWIDSVKELRSFITDSHSSNKWNFRISEAIDHTATMHGSLYEKLNADLVGLLSESDNIVSKMQLVANNHPWSPTCKTILNEMASSEGSADQKTASIVKIFSPVLKEGSSITFRLHGTDYRLNEGKLELATITDSRYLMTADALSHAKVLKESFVFYGDSEKSIVFDINEGTIKMGNLNMTSFSVGEIKQAMTANKFYNFRNTWLAEKVCNLAECMEELCEMDSLLGLTSEQFINVYLTMLSVEEGVWVNKINPAMHLNEMKFFSTATEALKEAKDFIGYDATSYLSEALTTEGHKTAIAEKRRSIINNEISFLEEKKNQINNTITKIGKSEELVEALTLIESEMTKKEKELQSTYITEKKTKLDWMNDGYTEATIESPVGSFNQGDDVMVNAEEYAGAGDNELVTVVNVTSLNDELVKRSKLKVKI
tara:strand:- start:5131 stop:6930 length:1800 start_codon:yes stop_codon:yes gene_type:complete